MAIKIYLKKHIVKEWRRRNGLTQEEFLTKLAEFGAVITNRAYYSRVECGYSPIQREVLDALVKITGMSAEDLISAPFLREQPPIVPPPRPPATSDNPLSTLEDTQKQLLEMAIKLSDAIRDLKQRQR